MAIGDSALVVAQTRAAYVAQNAALRGQAFDTILNISASSANILTHLQGSPGSGAAFAIKTDLNAGRMDKVNFAVSAPLGQSGRRGSQQAIGFEEQPIHSAWNVQIDTLRVVVGWSEIVAATATTGESWSEAYARMVGERVGQIEQEDMLMKLRQRSSSLNTFRPGNRSTLNTLRYDDTLDADSLGRAIAVATRKANACKVGKTRSGMDISAFVALASGTMINPLWQDTTFTNALLHAEADGSDNPLWTGNIPMWRNTAIKPWEIKYNDTPGPVGSSIEPQAVLGDAISAATTALTVYGGGRTQASLGSQVSIYKPFSYFYGNDYQFGESLSIGADATQYNFIVIDPADGKWCLYEYNGSTGINSNGASITCTKRLAAATSGTAYTTVGDWTWDATVNKEAFPTGSLIVQVNSRVVPVGDMWVLGADAGAKCYGKVKNKRIEQTSDFGALMGKGIETMYGAECRVDTLGVYRGFVRLQAAYQLDGFTLPNI